MKSIRRFLPNGRSCLVLGLLGLVFGIFRIVWKIVGDLLIRRDMSNKLSNSNLFFLSLSQLRSVRDFWSHHMSYVRMSVLIEN